MCVCIVSKLLYFLIFTMIIHNKNIELNMTRDDIIRTESKQGQYKDQYTKIYKSLLKN